MLHTLRALRSAAPRMTTASVHDVAAKGFGQGTNDLYDRARPSYPPAALSYIHLLLPASQTIIEPGAGTGIFTRLLLHAPDSYPSFNVKTLLAVEPSAGMREAWDKGMSQIPKFSADARAVDGGFDDLSHTGLPPDSADAVIIAQAWHWCPDHESALREIAKYLKPGAPLVLIWNLESNTDAWHAKLRETYQPHDQGSPQYYRGLWRAMFDTKACKELFSPPVETHYPWEMAMNEQQVVDRVFSKSYMTEANLTGDKRKQVEEQIRKVIQEGDKEWVDKENGTFKYKYTTDVVVLRKK